MKGFNYILFLLIGGLIMSCEKEIDIEIEDSEPRIVVECVLKDGVGANYILLSKTGGVYDDSGFDKISNASITVTDQDGNEFVFLEDLVELGMYTNPSFKVLFSNNYSINIVTEGEVITGTSMTNSTPKIDSLTFQEFTLASQSEETEYLITYHSSDPLGEVNSYRVKISINGEESGIYFLGNDDFIDGQYYEGPFFGAFASPGDTIFVELISMDEQMYRYYIQLLNNFDQSPFSAAPANPDGGLIGEAEGYFGVFTTDTMSLVLPN